MSGIRDVYGKLLEVWEEERRSGDLAEIPEGLESELTEYVRNVKRQLKVSDRWNINYITRSTELDMISKLLRSLFEMRMNKIVNMTLNDRQPSNMLEFERITYLNLSKVISEHKDKIGEMSKMLRILSVKHETSRYEVVCFLQPLPKIVGEDGKSYGPFKKNDIATLPPENARILLRKGVIRKIAIG